MGVSGYYRETKQRAVDQWRGFSTQQRWGLAVATVVFMALIPVITTNFFLLNMFIFAFIFIILGHSWNILGGYAGQISLGHAVLFAMGAYTTTILFVFFNVTPLIGIWIGALVAVGVGLTLGAATFHLRYHYFAMATLAAALAFRVVFFRWQWVGAARGIEYPLGEIGTLYSFTFAAKWPYFYITGTVALLVTLFVYVLDRSKLGTYLKAIHMDQDLAENAGLPTYWYKMYAMGLSAFFAGIAGGLYAQYVLFIDPETTLRLLRNIDIMMVAIIGGVGTVLGPVLGGFIYIPVREYARTTLSGPATGLGWATLGLVLIIIAIYRPGGLLNKYTGRWGK